MLSDANTCIHKIWGVSVGQVFRGNVQNGVLAQCLVDLTERIASRTFYNDIHVYVEREMLPSVPCSHSRPQPNGPHQMNNSHP